MEAIAIAISVVALFVAIGALVYTRQQAHAVTEANRRAIAPTFELARGPGTGYVILLHHKNGSDAEEVVATLANRSDVVLLFSHQPPGKSVRLGPMKAGEERVIAVRLEHDESGDGRVEGIVTLRLVASGQGKPWPPTSADADLGFIPRIW